MSWEEKSNKWQTYPFLDADIRKQLDELATDPELMKECFYDYVAFGTGGMRAKMGPGINRMNIYTIRRAAYGLACVICAAGLEVKQQGVAIAYDSRHNSQLFAEETARTLGEAGIKVYLFSEIAPTPLLSFAVRHIGCYAGIVITASHNPSAYNGFKVYGADGGQCSLQSTQNIVAEMDKVTDELKIKVATKEQLLQSGILQYIGAEVNTAYLKNLTTLSRDPVAIRAEQNFKLVYTPLHGTGLKMVCQGLAAIGIKNITLVEEQIIADGNFPTVIVPNPEEAEAFSMAMKVGRKLGSSVLLATDPDCDRLGVAVLNDNNEYTVLSGNQIGALLLEYWLWQKDRHGELTANPVVINTIVTSELGKAIANHYGCELEQTLTGFKFIGEKINEYEKTEAKQFVFGYEESNGYLLKPFVREKDAVQAAVMFAELATVYYSQGKTVFQVLQEIYRKYGYYKEETKSITITGLDGEKKMRDLMIKLRSEKFTHIGDMPVLAVEDYESSQKQTTDKNLVLTLPKANVLKYQLANKAWVCVRPSGTEPKIKFYFGVKGSSESESAMLLTGLQTAFMNKINSLLA